MARVRTKSRLKRTALPLALVLLGATAHGTSAPFTAARSTPVLLAGQPAYSCAVDYPSTVTGTPGLVNYWRLGESTGATAVDQTGAVDGTYVNGPTLGQAPAKPSAMGSNTSLRLNGSNQFVDFGDVNDFSGTVPFTVEAWIYWDGTTAGNFQPIFSKLDESTYNGWSLRIRSDNTLFSERWSGGVRAGFAYGGMPVPVRTWNHVVATSTPTTLSTYLNGVPQATATNPPSSIPDTATPLRVGSSYFGANPTAAARPFPGSVDEVAVYDRALTPDEIQKHTANCTYASTVARTPGLQSYWRLDEGTGTTVNDSGPNGVTGTYVGGPALGQKGALPSATRPSVRWSLTGRYANVGSGYGFTGNSPFSVEGWVIVPSTPATYSPLVSCTQSSSPRSDWSIWVSTARSIAFERWASNAKNETFSGVLPTATWTHFVATYDGTTMRMYSNGALTNSSSAPLSIPAGSSTCRIAGVANPLYTARFLDGSLDEVAVYNRALSASEVSQHYGAR